MPANRKPLAWRCVQGRGSLEDNDGFREVEPTAAGRANSGFDAELRAQHPDHVWTWDFIFDRTRHGRSLKWFSVVDEYTRECLALEVERRMTANDVLDVLADLFTIRGVPKHIRSDNGPEFIAQAIRRHLAVTDIGPLYIEPGAPWENGYGESFQGKLRDELLNAEEFENVAEAKTLGAAWRAEYNHRRPHSSLGYQTPAEFASSCRSASCATLRCPTDTTVGEPVLTFTPKIGPTYREWLI